MEKETFWACIMKPHIIIGFHCGIITHTSDDDGIHRDDAQVEVVVDDSHQDDIIEEQHQRKTDAKTQCELEKPFGKRCGQRWKVQLLSVPASSEGNKDGYNEQAKRQQELFVNQQHKTEWKDKHQVFSCMKKEEISFGITGFQKLNAPVAVERVRGKQPDSGINPREISLLWPKQGRQHDYHKCQKNVSCRRRQPKLPYAS